MPLAKGKSKENIGRNIKTLMDEGLPQKMAIAIAMSTAGKSKPAKKGNYPAKKGPYPAKKK
jgi:hypothetical protein